MASELSKLHRVGVSRDVWHVYSDPKGEYVRFADLPKNIRTSERVPEPDVIVLFQWEDHPDEPYNIGFRSRNDIWYWFKRLHFEPETGGFRKPEVWREILR